MSEVGSATGSSGLGSESNSSPIPPSNSESTEYADNTNAAVIKDGELTLGSPNNMDRQKREQTAQKLIGRLADPTPKATQPDSAENSLPHDSLRARRNRRRAGGGAYAKLLLSGKSKTPKQRVASDDLETSASPDTALSPVSPLDEEKERKEINANNIATQELDEKRRQTLEEFTQGNELNSRYHPSARLSRLLEDNDDTGDETMSFASLPSVLNRSEIFHEDATAAVLALLTPAGPGSVYAEGASVATTGSMLDEAGLKVSSGKKGLVLFPDGNSGSVSAFRSRIATSDSMSVVSGISTSLSTQFDNANERSSLSQSGSFVPKSPITEPILSIDAERALKVVKQRMKDPSKSLADLLAAIASPDDLSSMDRGYMVRRKNACGAVKVLTANPSNRRTLCWTVGVLTALTSVLVDTNLEHEEVLSDDRTRAEFIEARKRAVSSLVNLAVPTENRIPVFHSPGLMQAAAQVIVADEYESRHGCCTLVHYLAKTQENRILLGQVPGLMQAMTTVIAPMKLEPVKMYQWENDTDEDDDCSENSFSSDGNEFSVQSSRTGNLTGTESYSLTEEDNSEGTPQRATTPALTREKMIKAYDKDPNQLLHGSRSLVFATLMKLVKEKDNTFIFARDDFLVESLVDISKLHGSSSHVHALKIIANLTRHPGNAKHLVFRVKTVVPAMILTLKSKNNDARLYALFTIQNLSEDRSCRQEVSNTKDLIESLCQRARHAKLHEEQLAAVSALKNLTDDPANLIPMSNTPECFATLMQIAHGGDERIQYLACDALSTLSHWLRKIATSGSVPAGGPTPARNQLFVPSLEVVPFNQWS
mmetsp:Transcript_1917/g.2821  ORF Transcript_1917/g.2821 Transcript_1917/m.2821 type:complete len:823 (-) Transcript_1917:89-2557(-)|eukprot:CAMPEP_0194216520 /NCGR_PEP_ID=MMETSP0156-20130528/19144_1 /TAXON_ID=33649 /ORGANISM="Thalassionema nitzschioides, Strain L26-B" /LENGTH=822 /DNA_ID=CAMNT_0038945307 /DNA_START=109 /DNA_END=2577 /DNA_ORIENTATION=-